MGSCITKKSNKIKKEQAPIDLPPPPYKPPPETDLLYIITTHFNPAKYVRRIQLHQEFCSRFSDNPSIVVVTVECAFEDQAFQVTIPNNAPYHIQVRSNSRLWIKECLMNIALNSLKTDNKFLQHCKYVAWIDDDIETKSYVNYDDKTYEKGPLADFHINKLNVNLKEKIGFEMI